MTIPRRVGVRDCERRDFDRGIGHFAMRALLSYYL